MCATLKVAVDVVCGGVLDEADGGGRYETLYKKNKAKADEEMKAYKNSEADLNVSSDDEDAKVAKGKKKKKAHKYPDVPKPALTPNILFSQAERENVRIAQ